MDYEIFTNDADETGKTGNGPVQREVPKEKTEKHVTFLETDIEIKDDGKWYKSFFIVTVFLLAGLDFHIDAVLFRRVQTSVQNLTL